MITIYPLGHERTKIKARMGRDHYTYDGVPERGRIRHETMGIIEVWFFDYNRFPADVQLFMARQRALLYSISLKEAVDWLKIHPTAMPCDQIRLDPMPEIAS